jgi:uroporphyrin-III C-methyltransferase/precorrin-2 dehydrogenase/sirohydrochlorin ferrochelatase
MAASRKPFEARMPLEARPGRMDPLARLPVFLALEGKRCVLVGDGQAVDWKLELLEAAGAQVQRYAVHGWTIGDLRGAAIAVGGFEDDEQAGEFAAAARAVGAPVNVIDKPAFCDFSFGAIVNRSPLVIGISTDGAAPIFAQAIRAKLEALLPKGFANWVSAAGRWRSAVKASGLSFSGRRKFWHVFTAHAVTHPESDPTQADFERFIAEVKGLGVAVENGSVTLVGAGPGDPDC